MKIYSDDELFWRFQARKKLTEEQLYRLFKKELGRKKLTNMQIRYLQKGIRYQGIWDIETSDFNPLGQFIICYCFERRDILTEKTEKYEYFITPKDIKLAVESDSFDFDKQLLCQLAACIISCDQVIGHYSTKFDFPFFRSRCLAAGVSGFIPEYDEVVQGDTWRMMKTSLKAPRNTLMYLSLLVEHKTQKTHVDLEHWRRIYFPSNPKWEKSKNYILDHCRKDVGMTRRLVIAIEKFNTVQSYKV